MYGGPTMLYQDSKTQDQEQNHRAGGMAQQVKTPAAEPDNLSLIPRTHMVQGKKQLSQAVL